MSRNVLIRRKKNGFTLVEVLVSLAIISIALVLLLELFNNSVKFSASSKAKYDALTIASTEIETLTSKPYSDVTSNTFTKVLGKNSFTCEIIVTEVEGMNGLLKNVDVTVSWIEKGSNKSVAISKSISNKE